jgi:hypothetical protein
MMTGQTGGCACGAVRYRLLSEPFDTGWCHCRNCQLTSGAPAMVFSTVPRDDYRIESGEDLIGRHESSSFGARRFCSKCGTPLTFETNFQGDTIDFTVATLTDPSSVTPGFHIFYASRIPWAEAGDVLPRHDKFRPDTRGLTDGKAPQC